MKYSILIITALLLMSSCKEKTTPTASSEQAQVEIKEEVNQTTTTDVEAEKVMEETAEKVIDVKEAIKSRPPIVTKVKEVVEAKPVVEEKPAPKVEKEKPVITKPEPKPVKEDKPVKVERPEKPTEVKPDKPVKPEVADKGTGSPTHKRWDRLLSQFVSATGNVDYKGLLANKADLEAYLKIVESLTPQTSWTEDEELAYWINAYNAYTVKLILDNYPVKSITDLHGGKPWDAKWINIAGKTYSLNNIENDIIRPKFNEPRIHFAVNCAAQSCPPLANKAFTFNNLKSLLTKQTKAFVNNSKFNTLSTNKITVSKIFEWYGSDFGNVATFVSRYADTNVSPAAKVDFKEYDWSLNGK